MGVIIYEKKGNKVESTHANRVFFFFFSFSFFEKKKLENLKTYEWFLEMLLIAVNLSYIFFNKRKHVYIFFFLIKGIENKGEKKNSKNQFQPSSLLNRNISTWKKNHNFNNIAKSLITQVDWEVFRHNSMKMKFMQI